MNTPCGPPRRKPDVFGFDFGGVLIRSSADLFTTKPGQIWKPDDVPPMDDAFETLRYLARIRFGNRMWIITHASSALKKSRTNLWLAHHNAYEEMGIPPERVLFCATRLGKGSFCKKLGITQFLDNEPDVLDALSSGVTKYLFCPTNWALERRPLFFPDSINTVRSWREFGQTIAPL